MDLAFFEPRKLPFKDEIDCFSLIRAGGAVTGLKTAKETLSISTVVTIRDEGILVAVGAVKPARPEYTAAISLRANFALPASFRELGYISVARSHQNRGLSKRLVSELAAHLKTQPLFATTAAKNMVPSLQLAGFVRRGSEWKKNGYCLSLWLRDVASAEVDGASSINQI